MSIEALKLAREALEEIALAGMSGTGQESDEAMTEWHARQAWNFISIAARQLDSLRQSIEQAQKQEPVAMRYDFDGYGYKYIDSGSGSDWQTRIKDAEPVFASPPQRQPLTLETVYETVIHWDEGGGKRSRRELARRIVELAANGISKGEA